MGNKGEKVSDFLPEGYLLFEEVYGDLNKDGVEDCVLIIKGTDKEKIVSHESYGELDRNRRGIIVLFKKGSSYELILQNDSCFTSENEDGGVYFAPELSVYIERGNLYFLYGHGRYGFWEYTFRFQNSDFELIGFDYCSSRGPVVNSETSINFSTKKRLTRVNVNENAESGEEVFKETWEKIEVKRLIKLSEIEDIDETYFRLIYTEYME